MLGLGFSPPRPGTHSRTLVIVSHKIMVSFSLSLSLSLSFSLSLSLCLSLCLSVSSLASGVRDFHTDRPRGSRFLTKAREHGTIKGTSVITFEP